MFSRTALSINSCLSRPCMISQKIIYRSIHISYRPVNVKDVGCPLKLAKYRPAINSAFIRYASTGQSQTSINENTFSNDIIQNIPVDAAPTNLIDKIPDAPVPPPPEALDVMSALAEPTFKSLGLGSWSPVGIVQQLLELIHVGAGVPWWATITIGTVCMRLLLFPLVILAQRSAAHLHNSMPGMQRIQARLSEARLCGDHMDAARLTQELMHYMKNKNCSPFRSMIVPVAQAPIFISFFFALKKMAALPVDSLREGGLYWFHDLTVCDPYYILPLVTSGTMYLTIRLGIDGPKLASLGLMRYVVQALPIFVLPFTMNFSAAIVWYWVSTNTITMIQAFFLKIPAVRIYFKIPPQITHDPATLIKPKKFREGFKESWSNLKLAREMGDRQQLDAIQFNKAGRGPIEKTYNFNPMQDQLKRK